MKIERNEVEIELTPEEIRKAYEEYTTACRIEDIRGRVEEQLAENEKAEDFAEGWPDRVAEEVLPVANRYLDKCEPFFEAYWDCINNAIGDVLKEAGINPDSYSIGRNTTFYYLYRDAANFKKGNSITIKGTLTENQKKQIYGCLRDGDKDDFMGYFIPRQIGLPEERCSNYLTEDDHCWFEVYNDAFVESADAIPTVDITAEELVKRFSEAKGKWDDVSYAL